MELPLTDTSRREYSICCEVGTKGAVPGRLSAAAKKGARETKSCSWLPGGAATVAERRGSAASRFISRSVPP
jgi:hypothetical protein